MSINIISNNLLEKICRICLDNNNINNMIYPCKCNGTSKYVHKKCLQRWITQSDNIIAKYRCMECNYEYKYKSNYSQISNCRCVLPISYLYITYILIDNLSGYILYKIYPNILYYDDNIDKIWLFISCVNVTALCDLILLSLFIFTNIIYYNFYNLNRVNVNLINYLLPLLLTFLSIASILYYSILISYILNIFVKIQITDNYYKFLDLYKFNNIVELFKNYIDNNEPQNTSNIHINNVLNNNTDTASMQDIENDNTENDDTNNTNNDNTNNTENDNTNNTENDEVLSDTDSNPEIIEIIESVKNVLINN